MAIRHLARALAIIACTAGGEAAAASCPTLGPGLHTVAVRSGGVDRPLALLVPANARPGQSLPLVFDLHGSGGSGERQALVSRLRDLADRKDFLVANPDGAVTLAGKPDEHYWNIPGAPLVNGAAVPAGTPDDVQYVRDAIDAIAAATCLDRRRVYATGLSGGGRMASLLACQLADRIAAVAPVAGLRAGLPGTGADHAPAAASCTPSRPVPILTFHGTGDPVNPYAGGGAAYWGYGVPVALARWLQIDGCRPDKVKRSAPAPHVVEERYTKCSDDAEVVLYRTEAGEDQGGGHVWPTQPFDATPLVWDFLSEHRLPR